MNVSKRIFLIDGHSLLHRAYYALPPLTTAQGEQTNAVYGFTLMLFRLLEEFKPDGLFVAFDVSGPTFRHEEYEEYKATRKKMPDDLRPQVGLLKELLDAFGIPRLELEGYEADDVIGTAARLSEEQGDEAFIVTGDRDALQLVTEHVRVLLTKKGIKDTDLVDLERLQEGYSLKPEQVPELKGLMGDSSDNIPGVPGVGEKTAMKLLAQYADLEELYENIDNQKGKLKERLTENKDQAFMSRSLAQIRCDIPLEMDMHRSIEPQRSQLETMLVRLEFKSLLAKLPTVFGWDDSPEPSADSPTDENAAWATVSSETLSDFRDFLQNQDRVACAPKVVGHAPDAAMEAVMVAADGQAWYLDSSTSAEGWDALFKETSDDLSLVCPDAKEWLRATVTREQSSNIHVDGVLAAYVLDPEAPTDLDSISQRLSGLPPLGSQNGAASLLARAERIEALATDLEQSLKTDDLWGLYHDVELPLAAVLSEMEYHGIAVDPQQLQALSDSMKGRLDTLTKDIHEMAGESFNINSPKQLGHILFEKLELPVIKRTKTGPSTSADVLEELQDHPIVAKILEFRQLSKLKSTYADALGQLIHENTHRIHTTFNQTVTATGRLSSTNPNLQNIPIRTEAGRDIRKAFIAPEGRKLVAADYSQIELRVLAHIAQDEKMLQAFRDGKDIHTQTAAEILDITPQEVTKEQRGAAKAINFGIVYGISAFGLARNTKISQDRAQKYIDQYFRRYPKIKEYMDTTVQAARDDGFVTTILDRRRYLPDIKARNYSKRSFAERTAMNSPIQGSAADIIKLAMLRVRDRLRNEKMSALLLLQVHDELVLEVPTDEVEQCAALLVEEMGAAVELSVPLDVDVQIGDNWKEMQTVDH